MSHVWWTTSWALDRTKSSTELAPLRMYDDHVAAVGLQDGFLPAPTAFDNDHMDREQGRRCRSGPRRAGSRRRGRSREDRARRRRSARPRSACVGDMADIALHRPGEVRVVLATGAVLDEPAVVFGLGHRRYRGRHRDAEREPALPAGVSVGVLRPGVHVRRFSRPRRSRSRPRLAVRCGGSRPARRPARTRPSPRGTTPPARRRPLDRCLVARRPRALRRAVFGTGCAPSCHVPSGRPSTTAGGKGSIAHGSPSPPRPAPWSHLAAPSSENGERGRAHPRSPAPWCRGSMTCTKRRRPRPRGRANGDDRSGAGRRGAGRGGGLARPRPAPGVANRVAKSDPATESSLATTRQLSPASQPPPT